MAGSGQVPASHVMSPSQARAHQLADAGRTVHSELEEVHGAREEGLAACRATIQAAGRAIRAVHRGQRETYYQLAAQAEANLRRAQAALAPHPAVAASGFLHDAEKEYAEARLTSALVGTAHGAGELPVVIPDASTLGVGLPAWLNGLSEAASELRRHLLDRLREGKLAMAEELLVAMEDVYDLLTTIDYPDAITGGLRRSTDALRGILERTRSDLTLTLIQARLREALEGAAGGGAKVG
jgi:translin